MDFYGFIYYTILLYMENNSGSEIKICKPNVFGLSDGIFKKQSILKLPNLIKDGEP